MYLLESWGQPQDTQEPQKRRQGPGPRGRTGPGPGPRPQAASFVVPGYPEAAPRTPANTYGSQVANLENLSVVTTYTKILKQLQNRNGHVHDAHVDHQYGECIQISRDGEHFALSQEHLRQNDSSTSALRTNNSSYVDQFIVFSCGSLVDLFAYVLGSHSMHSWHTASNN